MKEINNTIKNLIEKIGENLLEIKKQAPLIHNITNFVVMNDTANILIHLGASPVMAHAHEEMEDLVGLASASVLNIGTLTPYWVESMLLAGKTANTRGIPVVFDPVGAGASSYRTESSKEIIDKIKIAVIRGNAAEISILAGMEAEVKGVDAGFASQSQASIAQEAAQKLGTTVAVTGPQDAISDGKQVVLVNNGHEMLGKLTGTGCMTSAITGAFLAVEKDPVLAAVSALVCFGIAGEKAAEQAAAPGSFRVALMDNAYLLDPETIQEKARLEIVG